LINTETFQFQHDYYRLSGSGMRDTLNVDTHTTPGQLLERKLLKYARSRCIPLLLDANVNGIQIVRLNIFQSFCACAIRFHLGVCALPRGPVAERSTDLQARRPNKFFIRVVLNIVEMMSNYIQRVLSLPVMIRTNGICPVTHSEVRWLGFTAFRRILTRKQTRHTAVLSVINRNLRRDPGLRMLGTRQEWIDVVDPALSEVFSTMDY
jgi:telomerase reverse transcriptase